MKKATKWRAVICAGFVILSLAGTSHAQDATVMNPQNSGAVTKPAQADPASYLQNHHLVELEKQLRPIILAAQPDAKIELARNSWRVYYRSDKYTTHLREDSTGNISSAAPENFPDDFAEFLIFLSVREDQMYYRPAMPIINAQTFGTTFKNRYHLRLLSDDPLEREPFTVPIDHWVYREHDKLSRSGWIEPSINYKLGMTRYQFAVNVARLTENLLNSSIGPTNPPAGIPRKSPFNGPELIKALAALQSEFSSELSAWGFPLDADKPVVNGQTWQPRYEHISFSFIYGKGMDENLIAKIKQTIADYAEMSWKATIVAEGDISAQK